MDIANSVCHASGRLRAQSRGTGISRFDVRHVIRPFGPSTPLAMAACVKQIVAGNGIESRSQADTLYCWQTFGGRNEAYRARMRSGRAPPTYG